ncbi:diguanylate cyclase [Thiolapillus sp.]
MPHKTEYQELKETIRRLETRASIVDTLSNQLFQEQQFLKILLNTIPSPIFFKDCEGVYRHCNEAFSREILGLDRQQILGKSLFDLPEEIPVELAEIYRKKDKALLDNPGTQVYKSEVLCSDGINRIYQFYKSTIMSESGEVAGIVGIMLDITSLEASHTKLEKQNTELESISYLDSLTGLFNRRKFDEVYPSLLLAPREDGILLNFAIFDIDHFKPFNDTYGHPTGDEALKEVAAVILRRLQTHSPHVFRIGGEEFCILFTSNNEAEALKQVEGIRKDVEALSIPHVYKGAAGVLTVSAGLLSMKTRRLDFKEVYEDADQLLYDAKHSGRNLVAQRLR